MAISKLYNVRFEVVKLSAGGAGLKYTYRKNPVYAAVSAANQAGVAAVLAGNVSLLGGESIEILNIQERPLDQGLMS